MNFIHYKTNYKIFNVAFLGLVFLMFLLVVYFIIINNYKLIVICSFIPVIILLFFYFDKYFMFFFIITLFIEYTFPMRIQFVNLISFAIIFYFIINKDSTIFLQHKLPKSIQISWVLLLFSVFLSSVLTPHLSFDSIYYGFGFFVYMFISYITYRYCNDNKKISNLLNTFFYSTFIAGVIVLIFIMITGYIRFFSFSGMAYFDFTVVALIISLFNNFILGKSNLLIKFSTIIVFITLVTSLSRNSWIGFILSLTYGIFIAAKFQGSLLNFLKNKFAIVIGFTIIVFAILIFSGLGNILFGRITEIKSGLFTVSDNGQFINNSLETRILIWAVALNAFIHNPITGIGYFMFWKVSEQYNVLPQFLYDSFVKDLDAHTTLINILCETGIIGLSSFIFYLIILLRTSYKAIKISGNDFDRKISIILHIVVFFISVHSIYSGAFTFGQSAFQMHFFFGLAIANYVNLKIKRQNDFLLKRPKSTN